MMDDMSLIYNLNLCRICQIPDNLDLVNTSTAADNGETYIDLLKFIFNDILWIKDFQISVACKLCLKKIDEVVEFKRICIETNTRRGHFNLDDDNIKVEFEATKAEGYDKKTDENVEKSIVQTNALPSALRKKRKRQPKDFTLKPVKLRDSKKKGKFKVKTKPKTKISTKENSSVVIAESDDGVTINGIDDEQKDNDDDIDQDVDCSQMDQSVLKEIMCRVCKQNLPSYNILKKHMKKVHPKHLFYHCDMCESTFSSKDYWERHEYKHSAVKKYVCTDCGAKYITLSDLKHHMDTHKEFAKYPCPICPGKMFKTSNCLTKHKMLVHKDRKDYKHACTECGMRFGMLSGLRIHLLRHANIRKFSCHLCNKTFFTKQELDRHGVTHSNVREFKCELCPAEYKLKSVLLKHKAKVHGIGNYKYPMPKFSCTYCPKTLLSKCKLMRHIRTHTGAKPYKCRLCSTKFSCKSYVRGHIKRKHSIDVNASDFNIDSYYDLCETEESVPENITSGLLLNTQEKNKLSI